MAAVSETTIKAFREAMQRLANGNPIATDGRLTDMNLAEEAESSRATYNRLPQAIRDEWKAIKKCEERHAQDAPSKTSEAPNDQHTALSRLAEGGGVRLQEVMAVVRKLANRVQALELLNRDYEKENAALKRRLSEIGDNVAVLRRK